MIATRVWLGGISAVCVAAVTAAMVSQHVYGMQPCPWCVLQRGIFLAIATASLLALVLPGVGRRLGLAALVLLTGCGAAAALWQHFVAAASASCNLTLADRIVGGLGLDGWQPEVFEARASCADAAVRLFGLPYEFWSLALFVALALVAIKAALKVIRLRRST